MEMSLIRCESTFTCETQPYVLHVLRLKWDNDFGVAGLWLVPPQASAPNP